MTLETVREIDSQYILNTYKRYPLQITRGQGVYVYDENGREYLDFLSGIAVNALGYSHPAILQTIERQSTLLIHSSNLFYTEPPALLAKKLCELSGMDKVFFCNSGAEANELALKLSHAHANQHEKAKKAIVCMEKSFHGRTIGALSITKGKQFSEKFHPTVGESVFVRLNDLQMLDSAMSYEVSSLFIEPIQGEGGVNIASIPYLQRARALATQYDALLVMDEIQTGLGRTGRYFAFEESGIQPDIITLAKPLGAGLPIGAVLMSNKVAKLLSYGDHGTTFGANCLATACALTFLNVIEEENLLHHVHEMGSYFVKALQSIQTSYDFVKEVRGKGLMLALELTIPSVPFIPQFLEEGLIVNATSETVIRFLPPYIIEKEHVDKAISIIRKVFDTVSK